MDAKLKNSKNITANLGDVKKQPFYCLISTAVLTCVSNKLYIVHRILSQEIRNRLWEYFLWVSLRKNQI
jgi:hypothetical protein